MNDYKTGKHRRNYFDFYSDSELEDILRLGKKEKEKVNNFLRDIHQYLTKIKNEYKSRKINIPDVCNNTNS